MATWWARHAYVDGVVAADVLLTELDGCWATVATGVPRPPDATVLSGLVLPGFVNAHSHAFHRALRGRTHRGRDSFWSWRDQMYAAADALTPDSYFRLARAVFAEMVQCGYTAVGEFHYVHHAPGGRAYDDPNAMSVALVAAARVAGIRLTLLDTLYLASAPGQPPNATQRRFSDMTSDAWLSRTTRLRDDDMVRHGLAVHSVRAVPPADIAQAALAALERDQPLHAHVSEQPRENDECFAAYGVTPVRLLEDAGALDANFTAVHATHLTDDDIAALGRHGNYACACITTERDLADGIGPFPALVAAGARLSIGSDSHAVIDPLEEARGIELDERLGSRRRGSFTAEQLLAAATAADSVGWPAAALSVGAPADLVEIGLDSARLAGSDPERLLDAAVYAATGDDVRTVVVGGRTVVEAGRHVAIDVPAELAVSTREVMGR